MSRSSFVCESCSAKFHYAAEQAGRKAKCPRCQQVLVIPVVETAAPEKEVTTVAKQEPGHLCAGCGKKIKPGVSRCKRCREEAKAMLATRIGHETRLEVAYTKQARFLASDPRAGRR